ncbi:Smr/MutS family protein [Yoonia sediminilitoris]|uniref:DNA-nicking Smr family endonuclease n=1 Tax=Yoonia sediminilitoris TaxID=1286148 RepID=A0A2T6KLV1_9RHOB|nr:Smr/MutS family protein [Yoonia sediminilitoris]PUB17189.1 DNA-nicking Smr family endonuclease [Yoonia sediminilitoris]RCW97484.1 DNA-nicking Smr family endonuclease [Yoonia sediminilitoris]
MRRPRHLSAEEKALWDRVAERTKPMDPKRPDIPPNPVKPAKASKPKDPVPDFSVGQKADLRRAHDILPNITDRLTRAPVNMDNKSFGKMKRGKLKPEARIDLHGMTMSEAHPELIRFIMGSHAMGRRLVLVITGKGKDRDEGGPIPTRHGVLRHQVPQWLALPPMNQAILQVTPAHLRHGGHGAYYVYLRRSR